MVEQARPAARRARSSALAALVVVSAAAVGVLGYQSLTSSSSTAAPTTDVLPTQHPGALGEAAVFVPDGTIPRRGERAALGEADGFVPDGTTVFDDEIRGVANLDPDLIGALRHAATDAAEDGVQVFVDSGWRSPEYQTQLLQEAVWKYGSEEEAARWVATPNTSSHVAGDAVDLGPFDATAWLSDHGAEYGLCQIYSNEPWHYELRPDAISRGCPPMYADPTHDPRMHQ